MDPFPQRPHGLHGTAVGIDHLVDRDYAAFRRGSVQHSAERIRQWTVDVQYGDSFVCRESLIDKRCGMLRAAEGRIEDNLSTRSFPSECKGCAFSGGIATGCEHDTIFPGLRLGLD